MKKKLISLNLAVALVLSLFPCYALTADAANDDIGYATFYFNNGTEECASVEIPLFLASNCNLTTYDALKKFAPAYNNHVLVGFSSSADSGTTYSTGDTIKDIFSTESSSPGVIYAQWEEVSGDYVVYRCGDGLSANGKSYIISPITDAEISLGESTYFTNSAEQSVISWVTGSGLDQRRYAPGSTISVVSGTEFAAVMGDNYIVFHDGDNERLRGYVVGDTPILESGGYQPNGVFSGWNTEQGGSGGWYYPLSEAAGVPHHLYAQYAAYPSSNYVVLTSDFGFEEGPMTKILSLDGAPIALPSQLKDQSTAAYWYGFNGKYYPAGVSVSVAHGECLQAQSVLPGNYYGVIDGDGGLTAKGSLYYATACYVTSAGNLNLYSFNDMVAFTKEGAAVSGYKGGKTGKVYSFNDDIWAAMGAEAEADNVANFTAQYEELTGNYIQYMGNGAFTKDGRSHIIQSGLDFSDQGGAVYAENPFGPPGSTYFLGWNTDRSGNGDWYSPGDLVKLSANTVLYAQWGKSRVTYHFTDHRGQPYAETVVDGKTISGAMSGGVDTSVSDVYSLALDYGLRRYMSQDFHNSVVTTLDAAKIIANLGNLTIDVSKSDLPYTDCDSLSALDRAVVKAVTEAGYFGGRSTTDFGPNMTFTRAQLMTVLYRVMETPELSQTVSPFTDVSPSFWFYPAVMYGLEAGIIITDRERFEPSAPATFLDAYRWAAAAYEIKQFGSVRNGEKLKDSTSQAFFEGWTDKGSGLGSWYIPGDSIPDGTVEDLYENWITTPAGKYYYVLTGRKMDNGRYTQIVELGTKTAAITLPSGDSVYGWFGGGLELRDIVGQRGFIDETESFYTCWETVSVTTGDVFRPLPGIFAVYHKNDGSSDAPRTYYYIASFVSLEIYGVDKVFSDLPSGKTFSSWNTNASGGGSSYLAGAKSADSLQLFAQWKSSSSPGSSSSNYYDSGTTTQTTIPVSTSSTTQGGASAVETTAKPSASVQNGAATVAVSTALGSEIVRQAVSNKSERVVIAPQIAGKATKTTVSIPAAAVAQIGAQTAASLVIATPAADVSISRSGLETLSSAGGMVVVTTEQAGNTVELSVTAGERSVTSVPGGVILTVPISELAPGTVAVLVNADNTREIVRKSIAKDGKMTIPLDGSARLEIVDNSKHFDDVSIGSWYADAVAFSSAHELFNGTGVREFSPDLPMSRGMLAAVLHNLEGNPVQAFNAAFDDVDDAAWYAEGITWAAAAGVVAGYGDGQFGPNDNITREQLAVMLWRYAGKPVAASNALNFTDAGEASGYALDALRWAAERGIINGYGNGQIAPQGLATRAQVAQMLKNYLVE